VETPLPSNSPHDHSAVGVGRCGGAPQYQRGCFLFVVYSVSFHAAGAVPAITREEQPSELKTGIRLARIDLQLFDADSYQNAYDEVAGFQD
jgi:hypothetical protein